jgi:S1-C subfamily serine protease
MKIKLLVWGFLAFSSFFLYGLVYGSSLEEVIDKAQDKTVKIGIVTSKGRGVCSGALISEGGEVLTCAHCFEHKGIKKVFMKTEAGVAIPMQLVGIDTAKDLALIAPQFYSGTFPYFKFGKALHRGNLVMSLGSPLGIQRTVTIGHVANFVEKGCKILHSAFINPGNSGGPLIDRNGLLIGINEATLGIGLFQEAHGLYMAIALDVIKEFLGEDFNVDIR